MSELLRRIGAFGWTFAACATLPLLASPPALAANWIETFFSAGHINYNSKESTLSTSNVSTLKLLWGQDVAGGVTGLALDKGVIYAQGQGSAAPNLAAIDAASGATKWTINTGNDGLFLSGTVATADGLVFTGCGFADSGGSNYGAVCAYKESNGHQVWQWSNPCNCAPESVVGAPLAYANGAVYFGYVNGGAGGTNYIVAANAKTGALLWTYVTGSSNTLGSAVLAVGGGLVYFTCGGANNFAGVCAVSQSGGSLIWSANFGTGAMGLSLAKGVLYVNAGVANEFAALDSTTGRVKWSVAANSASDPIAIAKNVLYARGSDSHVYALHAKDGSGIWSADLSAAAAVSLANGVLYDDQQGPNNPETAAYDASNGNLLWSSPSPGSTLHPPPIVANGVLFITDGSCGSVCAYGLPASHPH